MSDKMSRLEKGITPHPQCDTCVHWKAMPYERADGSCRRFPPVCQSGSKYGGFPVTYKSWVCGEWKADTTEPGKHQEDGE
jgi:hypothetical protein